MEKERKGHQKRKVGLKGDKKNKKEVAQNPKAFINSSFRNAEKQARRKQDLDQKRLHVPQVLMLIGRS